MKLMIRIFDHDLDGYCAGRYKQVRDATSSGEGSRLCLQLGRCGRSPVAHHLQFALEPSGGPEVHTCADGEARVAAFSQGRHWVFGIVEDLRYDIGDQGTLGGDRQEIHVFPYSESEGVIFVLIRVAVGAYPRAFPVDTPVRYAVYPRIATATQG
jgi:hypothetical protein